MPSLRQRGFSLIELVAFIVIVGVAVVGVVTAMNLSTRHSVDPQRQKQALAIAEALLAEIELMPFTLCDPDDPQAAVATVAANCDQAEALGPEAAYNGLPAETRNGADAPFDNVNDYHGFTLSPGDSDLGASGTVVVPPGYSASVAVSEEALGPAAASVPALRIAVTVTYGDSNMVVEAYRTRYAPNVTP